MKKTITLMLTVMAACAQADITFDFDSNVTYNAATDTPSLPSVIGDAATISASTLIGTSNGTDTDGNPTTTDLSAVLQSTNYLVPSLKIGRDGNSWSYTLTFSLATDFTAGALSVNLQSFNSSGTPTYFNVPDVTHTLTLTGDTLDSAMTTSSTISYAQNNTAQTLTLGVNSTLKANTNYTITLELQDVTTPASDYRDMYVGIDKLTLTGKSASIPEPATATLSLLALAGLAARRRRK